MVCMECSVQVQQKMQMGLSQLSVYMAWDVEFLQSQMLLLLLLMLLNFKTATTTRMTMTMRGVCCHQLLRIPLWQQLPIWRLPLHLLHQWPHQQWQDLPVSIPTAVCKKFEQTLKSMEFYWKVHIIWQITGPLCCAIHDTESSTFWVSFVMPMLLAIERDTEIWCESRNALLQFTNETIELAGTWKSSLPLGRHRQYCWSQVRLVCYGFDPWSWYISIYCWPSSELAAIML